MRAGFVKGLAAGTIMGAAAGMILLPNMDRKTQQRMKKSYRNFKDSAEDVYSNIVDWVK